MMYKKTQFYNRLTDIRVNKFLQDISGHKSITNLLNKDPEHVGETGASRGNQCRHGENVKNST